MTRHARVYTEMVTTGALIHGDSDRHLKFNEEEHPVALQLGGSTPADLAVAAKMGAAMATMRSISTADVRQIASRTEPSVLA